MSYNVKRRPHESAFTPSLRGAQTRINKTDRIRVVKTDGDDHRDGRDGSGFPGNTDDMLDTFIEAVDAGFLFPEIIGYYIRVDMKHSLLRGKTTVLTDSGNCHIQDCRKVGGRSGW